MYYVTIDPMFIDIQNRVSNTTLTLEIYDFLAEIRKYFGHIILRSNFHNDVAKLKFSPS